MKPILILCPLNLELEALIAALQAQGHQSQKTMVGPITICEFADLGWRVGLAGHGKTQFGIQTQFLIDHYRDIAAVLCCGCAGGLAEEVAIFDVVVATKTIEHDYRLKFVTRPDPEFPGDKDLLERVSSISADKFKIHLAPIASGDEDIIDLMRASELRQQTGAAAVAWEGAGGARASLFNKIPFLEIRGVTDSANNTAPVHFATNLKQAMSNVSEVLIKSLVTPRD